MKKIISTLTIFIIILIIGIFCISCNANKSNENFRDENTTLNFAAPEGTPALAILRMPENYKKIDGTNINYKIVSPTNIAAEMSSKESQLIIMPINAGANLIRQGAKYKLVSIAVEGSLFMIGNNSAGNHINLTDIIGKKIACIGKTGIPGLIFRFVMKNNGINIIENGNPNSENNEILVQYVADGNVAKTLLSNNQVDFAVVGEPAASALKNALNLNSEMNIQSEYSKLNSSESANYAQAGLFVVNELAEDERFMNELFAALKTNKDWINSNPNQVMEYAKNNLYPSAMFPAISIPRCAINAERLTDNKINEIISLLKKIMPKDAQGNVIDWDSAKNTIFK